MSATYRGTELPNVKVADGSPVLAFKTWGYFGANGENYMHGGRRGTRFSFSGIGLRSVVKQFPGWKDGVQGNFIANAEAARSVLVLDVTFGNWFRNKSDGLQYQRYTMHCLELRPTVTAPTP